MKYKLVDKHLNLVLLNANTDSCAFAKYKKWLLTRVNIYTENELIICDEHP